MVDSNPTIHYNPRDLQADRWRDINFILQGYGYDETVKLLQNSYQDSIDPDEQRNINFDLDQLRRSKQPAQYHYMLELCEQFFPNDLQWQRGWTIFVPPDDTFPDKSSILDPQTLLKAHLLPYPLWKEEMEGNFMRCATTYSPAPTLIINGHNDPIQIGCSYWLGGNTQMGRGVIHFIDRPLYLRRPDTHW